MAKAIAAEVPPPGLGFVTVTWAVPVEARSLAGTEAVTRVLLPKVVARAVPFQFTTLSVTKFVPFTVRVKVTPPTAALAGDTEVRLGTGLLVTRAGLPAPAQPQSAKAATIATTNSGIFRIPAPTRCRRHCVASLEATGTPKSPQGTMRDA